MLDVELELEVAESGERWRVVFPLDRFRRTGLPQYVQSRYGEP